MDEVLGGGLPLGCITEFVGESGVGKSQFMTQACVTTQLLESFGGLGKEVIYISTESGLATSRAQEITDSFRQRYPHVDDILPMNTLDRIHVVVCPDLELQDHMLYFQVPVLLKQKRGRIGSIIIDSVAANYRAEHLREGRASQNEESRRAGDMGSRTKDLARLAAHLRSLAKDHNIAIIVANQVGDRIERETVSDVLALDHQSQWFNGWTSVESNPKVPALGLVWANSVHCRIALKMTNHNSEEDTVRQLSLVYSPFVPSCTIDYKITTGGVYTQ